MAAGLEEKVLKKYQESMLFRNSKIIQSFEKALKYLEDNLDKVRINGVNTAESYLDGLSRDIVSLPIEGDDLERFIDSDAFRSANKEGLKELYTFINSCVRQQFLDSIKGLKEKYNPIIKAQGLLGEFLKINYFYFAQLSSDETPPFELGRLESPEQLDEDDNYFAKKLGKDFIGDAFFSSQEPTIPINLELTLKKTIKELREKIFDKYQKVNYRNGGTTLSSVIVNEKNITICNVGDSRSVLCIRTKDDKVLVISLTADNKPCDIRSIVRNKDHIFLRSGGGVIRIGLLNMGNSLGENYMEKNEPDIYTISINQLFSIHDVDPRNVSEISVACFSDGVTNFFNNERLAKTLTDHLGAYPDKKLCKLSNLIGKHSSERYDDISVVMTPLEYIIGDDGVIKASNPSVAFVFDGHGEKDYDISIYAEKAMKELFCYRLKQQPPKRGRESYCELVEKQSKKGREL